MAMNDDIIEKIRKCMRLARNSGSEGEKNAAEASAKRLADKAGLSLSDIIQTDSAIKTDEFCDNTLHPVLGSEIGYVTAVLRQHFGIILIQCMFGRKVKYKWVGTKINVEIAKHVFEILIRECRKDWKEARIARSLAADLTSPKYKGYRSPDKERRLVALSKLNKRAFLDGWFYTIHQKLIAHPLRNDIDQFNAEKKSCEEFFKKMQEESDIKDKRKKNGASELDRTSVMMGFDAAKKVNLNRPCDSNGFELQKKLG